MHVYLTFAIIVGTIHGYLFSSRFIPGVIVVDCAIGRGGPPRGLFLYRVAALSTVVRYFEVKRVGRLR